MYSICLARLRVYLSTLEDDSQAVQRRSSGPFHHYLDYFNRQSLLAVRGLLYKQQQ